MPRRILGALLWLTLLPLVGSGRLVWRLLVALAALRPMTVLALVGLAVALNMPNPVSAQLAQAGIWPLGQVILARGWLVLGVGVLYHGLRSPELARLWRRRRRTHG
jgi:hypothetical protein